MMISSETILSRSSNAVSRTIDNEEVIVQPKEGMVTVTSITGTTIWKMLDGIRPVSDIVQRLSEEFDISYQDALADSLEFLQDLLEKNLVVVISQ
ncbi:MAG: PqqD family protein [Lentisphaerae bacterium]|nr:PqqD family protein [Lentisphaerota bacterium]